MLKFSNKVVIKRIMPCEDEFLYPITPAQRRILLSVESRLSDTSYNLPVLTELNGKLDIQRMKAAWKALVCWHGSCVRPLCGMRIKFFRRFTIM